MSFKFENRDQQDERSNEVRKRNIYHERTNKRNIQ